MNRYQAAAIIVFLILLGGIIIPRVRYWWKERKLRKEYEARKKQRVSRWAGDGFLD
jgi:hypothetical protein